MHGSILPEINLKENLLAPINKGDIIGTIKYSVDDIDYTSNLIAGSSVIEQADYSIYLIIAGGIMLIFATMIMPKKNKKKKRRKRRR